MDAHVGPLLLLVQANIAEEHEDAFNSWYYHHVPKLLEIPGWQWGCRYIGVKGQTRYLALYSVATMDAMMKVMASDPALKDPRAVEERRRFDAIAGKTDVVSNIYEQIGGATLGAPLLADDHYLSVVMADVADASREAQWNAWYTHSHLPNLTQVPGYLSGARFRIRTDPRLDGRSMGPKYLALYEWEGEHCLSTLADFDTMIPQAKAELAEWRAHGLALATNTTWNVYKPIARHTSFR